MDLIDSGGGILLPYQKRWVQDNSRYKIGMFARQCGKTFTTGLEVVLDCYAHKTKWIIMSRGERQAREMMSESINLHVKAIGIAISDLLEYDYETEGGKVKVLETIFANGSRIIAIPANPDTARGFTGNLLLDEFAFHQQSRKIWAAVFPVASSRGFRVLIVSTGNGKDNKYYELMTAKDSVWSRHKVDIYEAVEQGLPRSVAELKSGLNDPDIWAQEYELQWMDESTAWLPYELINGVESEKAGLPEAYTGQPVFIGNDIGLRRDLWVAWVLEPIGDVLWTREIVVLHRAPFAEHDAVLDELMNKYRVARLCIDQTGMGEKPVEDAKRRYGNSRVEGVLFTSASKLHLANVGKQAFEDRTIRIPMGDEKLRTDLHKLRKTVSATGQPRFVADNENGHADRAWACFLALYAAQNPPSLIEYTPAPSTDWDGVQNDFDDNRNNPTGCWA